MPPLDAWEAALVLVEALVYGATLAAAGGVLFASYSHDLLSATAARALRRWLWGAAAVAALASAVDVSLKAAALRGEIGGMFDAGLTRMVWSVGESHATVLRLVGLALMSTRPVDTPRLRTPKLAGVILAATSFAWVGHTHAATNPPLPVALLAIHLLAVSFWVGALVPLLVVARGGDAPRMAAAAARFSGAALLVVAVLVAAGGVLLWSLLAQVADLWSTAYGRSVLIKLGMVAGLLLLAALNRWLLTPRLLTDSAPAMRLLRWSIHLEIWIACAIFIATAAMTTLSGPAGPR